MSREAPMPSLIERLNWLEDIIFAAVCNGIDATHLIAKRARLLWEMEQGDHS